MQPYFIITVDENYYIDNKQIIIKPDLETIKADSDLSFSQSIAAQNYTNKIK